MKVDFFQEEIFFREASRNRSVWTIHKDGSVLKVQDSDGNWCTPYWSARDRAQRFIRTVENFSDFLPLQIPMDLFLGVWLPEMKKENRALGINWTEVTSVGLEMTPEEMLSNAGSLGESSTKRPV
jgi:hypothetical protein